jgi:hypothetical protein
MSKIDTFACMCETPPIAAALAFAVMAMLSMLLFGGIVAGGLYAFGEAGASTPGWAKRLWDAERGRWLGRLTVLSAAGGYFIFWEVRDAKRSIARF